MRAFLWVCVARVLFPERGRESAHTLECAGDYHLPPGSPGKLRSERKSGREGRKGAQREKLTGVKEVAAETETWGINREVGRGSCHRSGVAVGAWS